MARDLLHTLGHGFDWRVEGLAWPVTSEVGPGLRGVVATTTRVMWLDPASGRLAYRGIDIDRLARGPDFEGVTFLLLTGLRPDEDLEGWTAFRDALRSSRELPADVVSLLRDLDPTTHPTRLLRAGVAALGCHELTTADDQAGTRHWRELQIVGQVAGLVAEVIRIRRASPAAGAADPQATLAAGLLQALGAAPVDPEDAAILELLWVLYAAHGLDSPTFASMIVASCLAEPYATVVAGLSAQRGARQAGASETVIRQLESIREPAAADAWVRRTVAAGGRIAGFGHPDYRMPDPRVVILRRAAAAAAARAGRPAIFEIARAVEEAATRQLAPRGVHVNVNLYGAVLLDLLGVDAELAPCLIAVARMAGLVALVRESLDRIRLYRPLTRYVGPPPRSLSRRGGR